MDIVAKARGLETRLAHTVDSVAARVLPARSREPLEIAHAVVEAVEREVQPAGRGRHLFPFNRIAVFVLAPSRQTRARIEAVFATEPTLEQRIAGRLEAAGCAIPDLMVTVACVDEGTSEWGALDFHVEFERVAEQVSPTCGPLERQAIQFEVVAGTADVPSYAFQLARIELGRCREVLDRHNRVVRTNHVAFVDEDSRENRTVSRRHAHVELQPSGHEFRLFDDGSEQGTSLARSGRTIAVPPGSRGVRLQSGDEIVLGQARLRVKFESTRPQVR